MSSAQLINKIRRHFSLKKIGHGGTLDPFATGLMIVLIGEATKVAKFFLSGVKGYEAEAYLGKFSTTGDCTGDIQNKNSSFSINKEFWETKKKSFVGKVLQTPPMYSALKYKGQPLYQYAREGKEISRKPREIEIYNINILSISKNKLRFSVLCEGGTYIRTLAEDWAALCGTSAYLQFLCRTRSSKFHLSDAFALDDLMSMQSLPKLISAQEACTGIDKVLCTSVEMKKIAQGNLKTLNELLCFKDQSIPADVKNVMILENEVDSPLFVLASRTNTEKKSFNSFKIDRIVYST